MKTLTRCLIRASLLLAFAQLAFAQLAHAGTVEVVAVNADHFVDAGNTAWDEKANVQALSRFLEGLGARLLPPDTSVRIELLDVDLAGTVKPSAAVRVRTVRGAADIPRIQLRYTVQVAGRTALSGEEWVSDPQYTRGLSTVRSEEPLYYEKRMLREWFNRRFVQRG
ncbi:MAG TPA: DUF3016 domain-containing protein [Ramlibacter sp.]|uniref:DUF3016 domain-containing protein n=1 Tax=Ramlibacter sp. TaxID=1917967 RepID=UPI002C15AD06|nr:DUF3016 domain-containing protein [Ramlibacter sp.]HVZ46394.1 DUF3016 domain-containing protein [Ramlibacter sp.]